MQDIYTTGAALLGHPTAKANHAGRPADYRRCEFRHRECRCREFRLFNFRQVWLNDKREQFLM